MAAYRMAARLFPGCHQANLFIGMEYIKKNDFQTAMKQFELALDICDNDPLVYNEMGVAYYK